jgi:hypothetical protein
MYRGFDGMVYVSTTDGSTVWQHRLAGHDDDWVYLDSGAVEE